MERVAVVEVADALGSDAGFRRTRDQRRALQEWVKALNTREVVQDGEYFGRALTVRVSDANNGHSISSLWWVLSMLESKASLMQRGRQWSKIPPV